MMEDTKKRYNRKQSIAKVLVVMVLGLLSFGIEANAQTAMVTNNFVYYPTSGFADSNFQCTPQEYSYYPSFPKASWSGNRSFSTITVSYNGLDSKDCYVRKE